MAPRKPRKIKEKGPKGIGGFFLRGMVTVLPAILTMVVFGLLFQMITTYVTRPINRGIYWSLEGNAGGWAALEWLGLDPLDSIYLDKNALPPTLDSVARNSVAGYADPVFLEKLEAHRAESLTFFRDLDDLAIDPDRLRNDVVKVVHPLVGVVVSLLVVIWLGWLVGGFVGRRIVQRVDGAMNVIPVVKSVYPYSKQLVDFFFAEKKLEFDTVVCVPYPSPGLWSIGFVTGSSLQTLRRSTELSLVTVFIPSSPMPMTGYTIFVEASRVVPLPISVDEALRITMTGGVLVPPKERVDEDAESLMEAEVQEAG